MLEPEEFEFYEYLSLYKEMFGEFPPTHDMPEKEALKLIKKSIEDRVPISDASGKNAK